MCEDKQSERGMRREDKETGKMGREEEEGENEEERNGLINWHKKERK